MHHGRATKKPWAPLFSAHAGARPAQASGAAPAACKGTLGAGCTSPRCTGHMGSWVGSCTRACAAVRSHQEVLCLRGIPLRLREHPELAGIHQLWQGKERAGGRGRGGRKEQKASTESANEGGALGGCLKAAGHCAKSPADARPNAQRHAEAWEGGQQAPPVLVTQQTSAAAAGPPTWWPCQSQTDWSPQGGATTTGGCGACASLGSGSTCLHKVG